MASGEIARLVGAEEAHGLEDESGPHPAGRSGSMTTGRFFLIFLVTFLLLCALAAGGWFLYKVFGPRISLEQEIAEVTAQFESGEAAITAFLEASTPEEKLPLCQPGASVLPFLEQLEEWGLPLAEAASRITPLTDHKKGDLRMFVYLVQVEGSADGVVKKAEGQMMVHLDKKGHYRVNAVRWYDARHQLLERFARGEFGESAIFPVILERRSLLSNDQRLLQGRDGFGLQVWDLERAHSYDGLALASGETGEFLERFVDWNKPRLFGVIMKREEILGQTRLWVTKLIK